MSTLYGGPAAYGPPRKVNFGWIGESFELFKANAGVWIVAVLVSVGVPALMGGLIGGMIGFNAAAHPPPVSPTFGGPGAPFGSAGAPFGGGASPFGGGSPFNNPALGGGLPLGVNVGLRIFSWVWTAFFYGGVYRMAVNQVRGRAISFGDIFSGGPTFLPMLGFSFVYGLAVGVGTLLCVVPGFLLAGLLLAGYALIADGAGIGDAISRSNDGMKADMWSAAGFVFVLGLLVLVSAIPCGLGLFVTMPMFWLISALAYRDMVGMPGLAAPAGPVYGQPQSGVWPPPPAPGQAPPVWGQTPGQAPPGNTPPRTSLSGEPMDEPPGNTPPGGRA